MNDNDDKSNARWIPEIDDFYRIVDSKKGTIEFIKNHSFYKVLRNAFMAVGIDIDSIKTEEELDNLESTYEEHITNMILSKYITMKPKTLSQQMVKARLLGYDDEAKRIREKLLKQKQLGLHISNKTKI